VRRADDGAGSSAVEKQDLEQFVTARAVQSSVTTPKAANDESRQ